MSAVTSLADSSVTGEVALNPDGSNIGSSGGAALIQYTLDGSTQTVIRDTSVSANNRPLPVEIIAASGVNINVTAGDIGVQLDATGANPDSVRIGDGTDTLAINTDGSINIADAAIHSDYGTAVNALRVASQPGNTTAAFDDVAIAAAQQTQGATTNNVPLGAQLSLGWDGTTHREIAVDTAGAVKISSAASSASNASVSTSATGATFVPLTTAAAERVTVINDTGTDLELRQGGSGVAIPVFTGSFFTFEGITDADDLEVRRVDTSNTQVTVKYRLES